MYEIHDPYGDVIDVLKLMTWVEYSKGLFGFDSFHYDLKRSGDKGEATVTNQTRWLIWHQDSESLEESDAK